MPIKKYIDRLRRIDFLLRTKAADNINCLSKKLKLSRSSTLDYLKEMKEMGFPIKFCNKRKVYYYNEDGKMTDSLFHKNISRDEMSKINGGKSFLKFFQSPEILDW